MYNKQLLDEVCCDMKIINFEVRVISQAEGLGLGLGLGLGV